MMTIRDLIKLVKAIADIVDLPDFNDRQAAYAWIVKVLDTLRLVSEMTPSDIDDRVVEAAAKLAANQETVNAILDFILELLPQRKLKSSLSVADRIEVVGNVFETIGRDAYGAFRDNGHQDAVDRLASICGIDPVILAKILSIIIQLIVRLL